MLTKIHTVVTYVYFPFVAGLLCILANTMQRIHCDNLTIVCIFVTLCMNEFNVFCLIQHIAREDRVAFVGISNWALDPAKMNRGVMITRGSPDEKELEQSAR